MFLLIILGLIGIASEYTTLIAEINNLKETVNYLDKARGQNNLGYVDIGITIVELVKSKNI